MVGMVTGVLGLGIGVLAVAFLIFLVAVVVEWRNMAARRGKAPSREIVPFGGPAVTSASMEASSTTERTAASAA